MSRPPLSPPSLTRRRLLQGAAVPALLAGCAPAVRDGGVTLEAMRHLNAMVANPVTEDRLARILPAVRLNHAFFRPVRALEIGDPVEPAVQFRAEGSRSPNP